MKIRKLEYLTWNGKLQPRTSTEFIILHHAAAVKCSPADIEEWHKERGFIGFGYNFFVDKDGAVFEGRPIWASDADAYGYNYNSLSICFEGDYDKETVMPEAQKQAGIELIQYLLQTHEHQRLRVVRHKDVNDTTCPGKYFPDDIILKGSAKPLIAKGNVRGALEVLVKEGVINSPDYWVNTVQSVKYLDELLVNMANRLLKS